MGKLVVLLRVVWIALFCPADGVPALCSAQLGGFTFRYILSHFDTLCHILILRLKKGKSANRPKRYFSWAKSQKILRLVHVTLAGANLYNPVMHSSICAWGFHEPHSPCHPMAFGEWKVLVASWKVRLSHSFTNSSSWFSGLKILGRDWTGQLQQLAGVSMVSPHLHPAAGTRTRHPLLSKASFPVSLEIEQQSGLWLRPMIPTSLLCMSAASCPTPAAKVSSVVELSLNPPLNAAFDLVPPGSSSSVGSAALHPECHHRCNWSRWFLCGGLGRPWASFWFSWRCTAGHRRWAPPPMGRLADRAPWSRIADRAPRSRITLELLDLESPIELLDLESPIELADGCSSFSCHSDGIPMVSWSWRTHVEKILCSSPGQWRPIGSTAGFVMFSSCIASSVASWSRQASSHVLTWTP